MAEPKEIRTLAHMIDCIARKCWRGLPALMGKAPAPTREQLKDALFFTPAQERASVQGSGGECPDIRREEQMIDRYDPVLRAFPWEELTETVQWYAASHRREWIIYTTLISSAEVSRSRWGGQSAASMLADRFGLSQGDIYDIARKTPLAIAKALSMGARQMSLAEIPKDF